MTWQAHIEDQWEYHRLGVHLIDRWQGGYTLLGQGGETSIRVTDPERAEMVEDRPVPALVIPQDAAPALLAALSRHLGAVEHPEQLRKDYDAERARVDRLISHLTQATS